MRAQNHDLRVQLEVTSKHARDQANSVLKLSHKLKLSQADEYTSLKRIEDQMRAIVVEFKNAQVKLETDFIGEKMRNNSHAADERLDRLIQQIGNHID